MTEDGNAGELPQRGPDFAPHTTTPTPALPDPYPPLIRHPKRGRDVANKWLAVGVSILIGTLHATAFGGMFLWRRAHEVVNEALRVGSSQCEVLLRRGTKSDQNRKAYREDVKVATALLLTRGPDGKILAGTGFAYEGPPVPPYDNAQTESLAAQSGPNGLPSNLATNAVLDAPVSKTWTRDTPSPNLPEHIRSAGVSQLRPFFSNNEAQTTWFTIGFGHQVGDDDHNTLTVRSSDMPASEVVGPYDKCYSAEILNDTPDSAKKISDGLLGP